MFPEDIRVRLPLSTFDHLNRLLPKITTTFLRHNIISEIFRNILSS